MKLVTISRRFSPAEAALVKSRLDAAGIPVTLTHNTAAMTMEGYAMAVGGILVQVPEDRAADAKSLIQDEPAGEREGEAQ